MGKFTNEAALVTGGGSGIGRASSIHFAKEGARVIVADVNSQGGNETVKIIKEGGGEAAFVKVDVSVETEVESLIRQTVQIYGRLDYAHNNAGLVDTEPLTPDITEELWDRVIGVNLKGVWLCMKYEIPQMLKQGGGAIVNTSSVCGLIANPNLAAYVASKHGINGLTKAAALEYAKEGIRINSICPGIVRTPGLEADIKDKPGFADILAGEEPMGRIGEAGEIAEAVVWLCSDAASFVTGHCMAVDGGITAK
jgi:NAD(P)-dependent dehydrogenase (short-subunit alcohol dehydrogenase family)